MNTRTRMVMVVLAAAPVGIAAVARAEPTLRYNHDYVCGQERIVVGYCRHDSDTPDMPRTTPENDYCQLYYPDRPKRGGIEAMGVVLRGDVIRMLQQCGAFGAAGVASGGDAKDGSTSTAEPQGNAPAGAAPGGRPSVKPMPIGREMCPLLRRLEGLAREDFRSIDLGPDRAFGKDAETFHRTSMSIPGADCSIEHSPGDPVAYSCDWPPATEKEVDDQFVNMGRALENCTGEKLDQSELEFGDVTVMVHGIEYKASAVGTKKGDFLALTVQRAAPGSSQRSDR